MSPVAQIALPFDPATQSAAEPALADATGFEIGWDFAHHRLVPPAEHAASAHPVRQGFEAGRAAFGARTLQPSRAVRLWLGLRLQAWDHGQAFEEVMVTPRYLAQLEVVQCPVTRELLSHGLGAPSDAVVVRVCQSAGYAAGNLVVMSRRAAQARGTCDAAQALALAQRLSQPDLAGSGEVNATIAASGHGGIRTPGGLDATQWQRLASLLSLATALPHASVALLPLRVLPPNRLRLLNPVQALQALMSHLFQAQAYARRMAQLGALMPDADVRRAYYLFMNAMLARRLAVGWTADPQRVRRALEDAWAHPVLQRRWGNLVARLTAADCERVVRLAAKRQQAGEGWQWLDDAAATEGWALASQGRAVASSLSPAVRRAAAPTTLPAVAQAAAQTTPASAATDRLGAPLKRPVVIHRDRCVV